MFNFKLRKEKLPAIFSMKRVYQLIPYIHIEPEKRDNFMFRLVKRVSPRKIVRHKGVFLWNCLDIKVDKACEAIRQKFYLKHYLLDNHPLQHRFLS